MGGIREKMSMQVDPRSLCAFLRQGLTWGVRPKSLLENREKGSLAGMEVYPLFDFVLRTKQLVDAMMNSIMGEK